MRNIFIYLFILFTLTSCERTFQGCGRTLETTSKHQIRVTLYSGGEAVKQWEFSGIVNNQENTDGFYFYYENKLVEVSGDILIEYLD